MKKEHDIMLISQAFAQENTPPVTVAETAVPADNAVPPPPSTSSILIQNVGMIVLLVVMFYFLLIRPQQKRFKEHKEMIDALKPGDKVVTAGGLIGTLDRIVDNDEVIVDLGNGTKVSAVRSTIQAKAEKNTAAK
jgi:preprotein translocase subunit YajC